MTVHFIGAGPGAPDLITVRGLKLIQSCPVCLYAGSLVPAEVVAEAPAGARVIDTAPLNLEEIIAEIQDAHARGLNVARVHSGDPSIYGATAEQMRRLDALGIDYDVTPGVSAYAAAAAALKRELTLAGVGQTVIITRTAVRASGMPQGEDPSVDQQSGEGRAGINAPLWRGLSGRDRVSRRLARSGLYRGHIGRYPAQGESIRHHPDGLDSGRARPQSGRV